MVDRLTHVRQFLTFKLKQGGAHINWDYLQEQKGLFAYTVQIKWFLNNWGCFLEHESRPNSKIGKVASYLLFNGWKIEFAGGE